ncbi:PAS domain S-box protein [Solirubrobacter ginsenosidimutans]|uniref:histidine kinase n=1 Tax=Solirubrobacter ginsenosidimutans TaxID=490573 RepID=A0A9X3MPY8_9ACTN|nr:PAS domain S-box protein [Solirubrobacter ginsenosidimutans]MDA0160549.1 PAS domain S-box protein [Solirubrobacter ginsenosidimutans]
MRRDLGFLGAATAATIAVLVLAGALFEIEVLQDFGGARAMLPVGALAILTAAAGLARWRALGAPLVLGGVVALAGLLPSGNEIPVNAAVCVVLIGAALLALDRRPSFADGCALVAAVIAGLALIGYLFSVPELQRGLRSSPFTPMALPTAFAILALSAGLLAVRREGGLRALWVSDGPGGALLRRLAPVVIVLPVALTFLCLEGQRHGVFGMREGLGLLGACLILIFGALGVMMGGALERNRFRELAIIDATVDAVITLDAGGRVREFNPAAERLFGRRSGDVIGRELAPLVIPPEHREAHRRGLAHAVATGSSSIIGRPVELTALRADGSEFPAEVTISRLLDRGPALFVGHVRDVTERLQGELAARYLASLVESSWDAIVAIGLDGKVTSWNAGAERVYGYARDEAIGRPISEVIWPPDRWHELESQLALLQAAGTIRTESRHMRRDGAEFPAESTVSAIADASGAFVGLSLIARDITARHELEEQLRQAQKMEAVGQLAGGIAHDFNNLLTVISGYGQLALARIGAGDGAAELGEIERAAERATVLTRQLLAFSRRQMLDPEVLDLSTVARGLTPMLERLIGEDIEVELRSPGALPEVFADAAQIEQVLINLAVNARDAMPEGGRLLIETAASDGFVCLRVTDTGIGIEPEALPHVFEPFYTTKPVGEGTGLGLASVHGAITQSGGHVRVESEPGIGTTFEVYLPVTSGHATAPAAVAGAEPVGGHETILLCEDEEGVRALVELILSGAGYRVLSEARPTAVLARDDPHIDALVTDVIMPEMPGPELARRLQDSRPGLRTLFVSGYARDTVHGRGNLPPGSAFLEKPFDRETLLRTLRELLDRS